MGRVTVKTIAEAVGVSPSTVSNAYNRPDQLSAELRERILAVAADLGYAGPDAAARMLRSGRAEAVGVLLTERLSYAFSDPYAIGFLTAVTEVLEQSQTSLVLMPIGYEAQRVEAVPDVTAVRQANIDAMTILCVGNLHPATQLAKARGIRIVGTDIDPDPNSTWVAIDDVEAGAVLGRHLADLGHTRVGVIADTGFPAGTVTTGLSIDDITCTDCRGPTAGISPVRWTSWSSCPAVTTHRIPGSPPAVRCSTVQSAPARSSGSATWWPSACWRRCATAVWRPPATSPCPASTTSPPPPEAGLTTVRQPILEKGRLVGELLLDAEREPRQVLLPIELVVRDSTGVPAA